MLPSTRAASRRSSGSNSIEPFKSAKSTVTCFRSPSRAALEVRIFSARWLGVWVSGEVNFDGPAVAGAVMVTGWPHFLQNFAPARFGSPQFAHAISRRAPHSSQNAASEAFSYWHWGHFMPGPPCCGAKTVVGD